MPKVTLPLLFLLPSLFAATQAAEPATTKQEIAHLFTTLEASHCQFYRNGSWYGAKAALVKYRSTLANK